MYIQMKLQRLLCIYLIHLYPAKLSMIIIYYKILSHRIKNNHTIMTNIIFYREKKFDILRLREQQLNKKIKTLITAKVDTCNKLVINTRQPVKVCVVAIIGYTNAGKTTLIKKFELYIF